MEQYISIIVPSYNHAAFLQKRLDSVLNQTYQNFEVILLDDCSTDGSVEILAKYAHHPKVSHFEVNKQNSGSPFKQWQKGISLATGDFVWIAESDDCCEPNFLEKIFQFKNSSSKNLGLIYSQSVDVDRSGKNIQNRIAYTANFNPNIWEKDFSIDGNEFVEKCLKVKNVIPNASAVVFKRSLVDINLFSDDILEMKMCGDWFFWIKICANTDVGFVSETLNYFRDHINSTRNHYVKERKVRRLLEETSIRKYLQIQKVYQKEEVKKLYAQWFKLHSFNALRKKSFYKIRINNKDFLLKRFLFFKLKDNENA